MFVFDKIGETGADAVTELLKDLAVCTVNLIVGVACIVAGRNSSNEAAFEKPPVLSHQLIVLQGREFAKNGRF